MKDYDPHDLILEELRTLAKHVAELDKRLTKHMDDESKETSEINQKLGQLAELMNSMPHHDNGVPDLHGHRVDHEQLRETKRGIEQIKFHFKKNIVNYIMIALIVSLSSMKWSEAIKIIVELMK